jgi:hypothetical protein
LGKNFASIIIQLCGRSVGLVSLQGYPPAGSPDNLVLLFATPAFQRTPRRHIGRPSRGQRRARLGVLFWGNILLQLSFNYAVGLAPRHRLDRSPLTGGITASPALGQRSSQRRLAPLPTQQAPIPARLPPTGRWQQDSSCVPFPAALSCLPSQGRPHRRPPSSRPNGRLTAAAHPDSIKAF